jgi:hypothetical protein
MPAKGTNSLEQTHLTLRGLGATLVHASLGVTKERLQLMVAECSYATTNRLAALGSGFINSL